MSKLKFWHGSLKCWRVHKWSEWEWNAPGQYWLKRTCLRCGVKQTPFVASGEDWSSVKPWKI